MDHISQFESTLAIYYIHEERFIKTHTLVMSSSVWHNAQLWHTCKSLHHVSENKHAHMQTCCLLSSAVHMLMVHNLQNDRNTLCKNEEDDVAGDDALVL